MTAADVLERHFLEVRCKLLEIGAVLDRIDRAAGEISGSDDPRRRKIDEALRMLAEDVPNRAEQLQLLFSRDYAPDWLESFEPTP